MDIQIVLIRHGETESNLSKKIQGQSDSGLSPKGVKQAGLVGQKLNHYNLDALYTSSLGRAKHTAKIISEHTNVPITEDQRLVEISFGDFEGLGWQQVESENPDFYKKWYHHHDHVKAPRGETRREALSRFMSCLNEIAQHHVGKKVAVVTHGGILATFFSFVLRIPQGVRPSCLVENTGVNIVILKDGHWIIKTWGDLSHLMT